MLDWPLYHYVMPFFVSYYSLNFKSIYCWYKESLYNPSFLLVSICMEYVSIPSFSVCVCPYIWNESPVGSTMVFFKKNLSIQPLYLLTGELSPITFKVIIDRYVLIAILLITLWLFGSSLFLSSLALLLCDLMIFCSGMLRLLSLYSFVYLL